MAETRMTAALWTGAALLVCLSVTLINGGGLGYFDTGGYLAQGEASLAPFGLTPEAPAGADGGGDAAVPEDDGIVVGSRSAIYSALVAAVHFTLGLHALPVLHATLFLAALALPLHLARRAFAPDMGTAPVLAGTVLAASLGSLPFYVAYLMPDIFAPILLLMLATLTVFAPAMTWPERIVAVVFGIGAVVTHPSHLLIAALMVPAVALGALLVRRPGWWLAPLLAVAIVAGGASERLLFASAVKAVRNAEVVYQPFLTVRVIADGPGYAFLAERCPDTEISACILYAELQRSSDDYRLTASHIMFETSERLGSYRRLAPDDQKRIADDQVGFFVAVLTARPVDTGLAFLTNALTQAALFQSIVQTVPDKATLDSLYQIAPGAPAGLRDGRLVGQGDRLAAWLDTPHRLLYGASLLAILWLCLRPRGGVPAALRVFALMLVAGILANALVCGGVSQPSDRYGARVAFLLPLAAAFLAMFAGRPPHRNPGARPVRAARRTR